MHVDLKIFFSGASFIAGQTECYSRSDSRDVAAGRLNFGFTLEARDGMIGARLVSQPSGRIRAEHAATEAMPCQQARDCLQDIEIKQDAGVVQWQNVSFPS